MCKTLTERDCSVSVVVVVVVVQVEERLRSIVFSKSQSDSVVDQQRPSHSWLGCQLRASARRHPLVRSSYFYSLSQKSTLQTLLHVTGQRRQRRTVKSCWPLDVV